MTDPESDYDMVQMQIWVTRKFREEWKRFISRKWPEYSHGIMSAEAILALKMWMENNKDGRTAHTHKNTILSEAENKPNFHSRKTKLIKLNANSPNPNNTTVLVTRSGGSGNGKGEGEDKEHWKRPINEDPLLINWAKKIGMGDVFDDPKNIYKYASQETIANVRRCMVDPEFNKQYHQSLINRLLARKKQKQKERYDNALEERDKQLRRELVLIKKHLENHSTIVIIDQNKISEKNLYDAFVVATHKNDKRTFEKRLTEYIVHGYFRKVKVVSTEAYKMEEKFLQL